MELLKEQVFLINMFRPQARGSATQSFTLKIKHFNIPPSTPKTSIYLDCAIESWWDEKSFSLFAKSIDFSCLTLPQRPGST